MQRNFAYLMLPASLLAVSIVPQLARAQASSNVTVVAQGLQGPRGLTFGPDGLLYVAEAGTGGTVSTVGLCDQTPAPIGPYLGGQTGRISRVNADGSLTTVATGFPSALAAQGDHSGVADVAFLDGTLYALTAGGGCSHGNPVLPNQIAKVNLKRGTWATVADLSAFVMQHPTAVPDVADFEPDGEFYSLAVSGGKLLAVESNHGQILSITPGGDVKRVIDVSAWQGHVVPTAIQEHNGLFYAGNLGVFPAIAGASEVMTMSYDDVYHGFLAGLDVDYGTPNKLKILSSKSGWTTVVSLRFGPDGLLYALELSGVAGYPAPGTGKVVRLRANGQLEDIATGLVVPTAMTFGPDGKLYVSNFGAAPPGAGQIVSVTLP